MWPKAIFSIKTNMEKSESHKCGGSNFGVGLQGRESTHHIVEPSFKSFSQICEVMGIDEGEI